MGRSTLRKSENRKHKKSSNYKARRAARNRGEPMASRSHESRPWHWPLRPPGLAA